MTAQKIEITLGLGQTSETVACLTVIDAYTGRKAHCWLRAYIKPNGKCYAIIYTLGKSERGDRTASRMMPWHDVLD